jgi:hypothetical protein
MHPSAGLVAGAVVLIAAVEDRSGAPVAGRVGRRVRAFPVVLDWLFRPRRQDGIAGSVEAAPRGVGVCLMDGPWRPGHVGQVPAGVRDGLVPSGGRSARSTTRASWRPLITDPTVNGTAVPAFPHERVGPTAGHCAPTGARR